MLTLRRGQGPNGGGGREALYQFVALMVEADLALADPGAEHLLGRDKRRLPVEVHAVEFELWTKMPGIIQDRRPDIDEGGADIGADAGQDPVE